VGIGGGGGGGVGEKKNGVPDKMGKMEINEGEKSSTLEKKKRKKKR